MFHLHTHLSSQDVDPAVQGEVCPDPIADIIQYQVILRTGSFVNSESMNIARCAVGRCSHSFAPASNHLNGSVPSSFDSVSVAAENVVGVGAARTCAAQPISELTHIPLLCDGLYVAAIYRYKLDPHRHYKLHS